mmetsp:Transcript_1714/g.4416  ORF Transcript_1714/g.4416 Transcript_1714/m.4416 type:complete len:216 (+) Transcript_1714:677-1324(+)
MRHCVGNLLHRSPGQLRPLHQGRDLAQHGLAAQALHLHLRPATDTLGAADDEVTLSLGHRPCLTCQQGFIEGRHHIAFLSTFIRRCSQHSVRRCCTTREDLHNVTHLHQVHMNLRSLGLAVVRAQKVGLARLHRQEGPQGRGGLLLRPRLDRLANKDEGDHHAGCLEVGRGRRFAGVLAHVTHMGRHHQQGHNSHGVCEREERAEGDEDVHVPHP